MSSSPRSRRRRSRRLPTIREGRDSKVSGGSARARLGLEELVDSEEREQRIAQSYQWVKELKDQIELRMAGQLRSSITANALSNSPVTTDWTRQFDALVFIRTMFPSTKAPLAPKGAVLTEPLPIRGR